MVIRAPKPNDLVRDCLKVLALRGIPGWRVNSGAVKYGTRYVQFGGRGAPDVFAILPPSGCLLAIECKTGTGRLSADQRAWHARASAAGALCMVVRNTGELITALDRLAKGGS